MALEIANWIEIPVLNFARARRFYESLFRFTIVDLDVGGEVYPCFPTKDNNGYCGALVQYDFIQPGKSGPLVYFAADHGIDAMLECVTAHGGKIISARTEIAPGFGFMAVFEDSEGNMMALQGNE